MAMAVSALIFLAGVVMFGISLVRSGVDPRPAGWLFIVGFVVGISLRSSARPSSPSDRSWPGPASCG
jgi:hypothetical protein